MVPFEGHDPQRRGVRTAGISIDERSLTLQVRHHSAVKSTRTGRPSWRWPRRRPATKFSRDPVGRGAASGSLKRRRSRCVPVQFLFERDDVGDRQDGRGDRHGERLAGATALDELAPDPGGEAEADQEDAEPEGTGVAEMGGGQGEEPEGGGQHGESHRHLEAFHPGAGVGQQPQPGGLPAEDHVGCGESPRRRRRK